MPAFRLAFMFAIASLAGCSRDGNCTVPTPSDHAAPSDPPRDSLTERSDIEIVAKQILLEAAESDAPAWAGFYVRNDDEVHERLIVAPRGGFAYFCDGMVGISLAGSVVEKDGVLHLPAVGANLELVGRMLPSTLVPSTLGDTRWLSRPETVIGICNAWNQGFVQSGEFVRSEDRRESQAGRPRVPAAFEKYLLDTPIVGRVTKVETAELVHEDGKRTRQERVTLDVGEDSRAQVGMEFLVPLADGPVDLSRVCFEVEEAASSRALVLVSDYEDEKPLPRLGAIASTSSR